MSLSGLLKSITPQGAEKSKGINHFFMMMFKAGYVETLAKLNKKTTGKAFVQPTLTSSKVTLNMISLHQDGPRYFWVVGSHIMNMYEPFHPHLIHVPSMQGIFAYN